MGRLTEMFSKSKQYKTMCEWRRIMVLVYSAGSGGHSSCMHAVHMRVFILNREHRAAGVININPLFSGRTLSQHCWHLISCCTALLIRAFYSVRAHILNSACPQWQTKFISGGVYLIQICLINLSAVAETWQGFLHRWWQLGTTAAVGKSGLQLRHGGIQLRRSKVVGICC